MALAPGARLGPYEATGLLGAGGMGEVYRALDTRLRRDVALKVLPEAVRLDSARRTRFEQEARVLASLSHPNIAAIHGVEEHEGIGALVLELVEGDTLATRIARGPISPTGLVKVLDFGLAKIVAPAGASDEETETVGATRDGMVVGTAALRRTTNRTNYAVTRDSQRFLVNTISETTEAPITVTLDWTAALRH